MWNRRTGVFNPTLTEKNLRNFWRKVEKTDGCWLWRGAVIRNGYGQFGFGAKVHYVQRISYFLEYGQYDNTLMVCHKCDVRNCVRPDHLFLGTNEDNMQDMLRKGRQGPRVGNRVKGEKRHNSKLTADDVRQIRLLKSQSKTNAEIARLFQVEWNTVKAILTGKSWSHLE